MSDLIRITELAATRIQKLLEKRGTPDAYIRLGTKTAGCSGLSYRLEFSDKQEAGDELVEAHGVKVLIDAKALIYLIGTEMDYEETEIKQGFVFNNPNQKGSCGCGESFTV